MKNIFSIPPSAPFLPTLIDAIEAGDVIAGFKITSPLDWSDVTLYLPTRRACRIVQDMLLRKSKTGATILPRLHALGDSPEDGNTISSLERRLILANILSKAPDIVKSPQTAITLGDALAAILDQMITSETDTSALKNFIPEEFDEWWSVTRELIEVITHHWPDILKQRNKEDQTQAVRKHLLRLSSEYRKSPPQTPIIIAGSTGSQPATARLMSVVSQLGKGAVILPGLDYYLDDESYQSILENADLTHPQYNISHLLKQLEVTREHVRQLGEPKFPQREKLISEALRPAASLDLWRDKPAFDGSGITLIDASSLEEEAAAIALVIKEKLACDIGKITVISPDQSLSRRITGELENWGISVDDSAGIPLANTPQGSVLRLLVRMACSTPTPGDILSLLRHPIFAANQAAVDEIERNLLRGIRPDCSLEKLSSDAAPWPDSATYLERIKQSFEPFEDCKREKKPSIARLAKATQACLSTLNLEMMDIVIALTDMASLEIEGMELNSADWPSVLETLLSDYTMRPVNDAKSRVRILGLLEARLVSSEVIILCGLTEGQWPPQAQTDPFLNRAMRIHMKLDLPERRIGLSAHDFAQSVNARDWILSYSTKINGVPSIASRFIQRLCAVLGEETTRMQDRGHLYLELARKRDQPGHAPRPCARPAPRPPLEARPKSTSIREFDDLLSNPYAIYARHVLQLRQLDPVDAPIGSAQRGTLIHDTLSEYVRKSQNGMMRHPYRELLDIGEKHFQPYSHYPDVMGFWWPRFERIADWFVQWNELRRMRVKETATEISGRMEIYLGDGTSHTLRGRADRIDRLLDGSYEIIDYKTGKAPDWKKIRSGKNLQLPLEAVLLRAGGFEGIQVGTISALTYVELRGTDPAGEEKPIVIEKMSFEDLAAETLGKVKKVLSRFNIPETPYLSIPLTKSWFTPPFEHLARIREWSSSREGLGE